ncbi:enoyl-CoA hydratase/isomerase family protein [Janthinobacterium agaricidamnosum]|uniref:Putative enoyl-CoA hydratase n=1 Tax=Janthinobacterium agaricidamnosum NBRC 102515 = DSM 9628 TaxID=1349767 RepID=W0V6X3_9BURK|nr:enoyl-CoA hydratase/isomerase family protein [Janthinobacterium agaricidamnosum]CDG83098.1 putative enoyl-CoA hydratase [Janthinobacterium agaricidamnosum NBRC 102515 = DSM 9628]
MRQLTLVKSAAGAIAAAVALYAAGASAAPASAAHEAVVQSTAPIAAEAPDAKIRLTRVSPAYWKVTFASPPLNIVGPAEVRELVKIVEAIEADKQVKVVVFDSALPDYFIAHYDLLTPLQESTGMKPGPTGMHPVPDMMVRIARLPIVTISSIRGRATGIGSELVLATDMRFASREKAVLSQWEVGAGLVAGGGPMARLPRLVGRGRALEILIASDDINADVAERYGYVNRALPDAELDGFVDTMARRIASFDRAAIIDTKKLVNRASLPPDAEMQPGWDAFIASVHRPAARQRLKALIDKGLQQPGEIEKNLGQATFSESK